ncbi:hypothetical protein PV728_29395 [Streptomyces europaeiscabiei]|uniref:hypothetical protein n=1 Tax=Streptomyces europaeiscabiei TaxID=146819 RepID=UPI0029A038D7|nr:hypothetical protein [Streptomyces europaeiscabiei]MDX3634306.1 hypothetical protein [Streptomyces europaeiscabiei]MDX3651846.1 hypothetical protein [Streptomyces europaeiscabiei]
MLQHTVSAVVDTRIWNGTPEPALLAWLGDDGHHFDGTQLVIHTTDGDLYPEPGWTIIRWPDNDLSVMSSRAAIKRLTPTRPDAQHVTALYERWVTAGPPPIGTSISRWWDRRLAELRQALLGQDGAEPGATAFSDRPFRSHRQPKEH